MQKQVKGIKFADKMVRIELTEAQLHVIAAALFERSTDKKLPHPVRDYSYRLGRDFNNLYHAKPEPSPFDDLQAPEAVPAETVAECEWKTEKTVHAASKNAVARGESHYTRESYFPALTEENYLGAKVSASVCQFTIHRFKEDASPTPWKAQVWCGPWANKKNTIFSMEFSSAEDAKNWLAERLNWLR